MSAPRIRGVRARPLDLALERPVETSAGAMRTMPIVLIDVVTDAGITGRSYIRCYTPAALEPLSRLVANLEDLIAVTRVTARCGCGPRTCRA